jgi:hypothetical protein
MTYSYGSHGENLDFKQQQQQQLQQIYIYIYIYMQPGLPHVFKASVLVVKQHKW